MGTAELPDAQRDRQPPKDRFSHPLCKGVSADAEEMEIEVEGVNPLLAQSTEALPCFPGHVIYCLLVAELTVQQAPLKCLRIVLFPKNPQYHTESQEETLWEGK